MPRPGCWNCRNCFAVNNRDGQPCAKCGLQPSAPHSSKDPALHSRRRGGAAAEAEAAPEVDAKMIAEMGYVAKTFGLHGALGLYVQVAKLVLAEFAAARLPGARTHRGFLVEWVWSPDGWGDDPMSQFASQCMLYETVAAPLAQSISERFQAAVLAADPPMYDGDHNIALDLEVCYLVIIRS